MTNEEFLQWEALPHYVVRKHFYWAYRSPGVSSKKWRRHLDYDDLVQEGNLALLGAWEKWREDGGASFKTYAFTAIYRRVERFIDSNLTPVTTKYWQSAVTYDPTARERLMAAISCSLFSEGYREDYRKDITFEIPGDKSTFSTDDILHLDWVNHCVDELREKMSPRNFRILLDKAGGKKFAEIGEDKGLTREYVRRIYREALIQAAVILIDEEEFL
jgi:RNA polymerase sigma factor (sigma-70 family)